MLTFAYFMILELLRLLDPFLVRISRHLFEVLLEFHATAVLATGGQLVLSDALGNLRSQFFRASSLLSRLINVDARLVFT